MRRLLLVLCLLAGASSAEAAVAFDANQTAPCTANGRNLTTGLACTNLTISGGLTKSAMVCQVNLSLQTPTTEVVSWDLVGANQLMTLIVARNTSSGTGRAELWGLINPTAGNKSVLYTAVGTSDIDINCVSWQGVDATGGATSFPHSTSAIGTSAAPSVTITSAVGNATMDSTINDTSTLSAPTKTQTFIDNVPNLFSGGGSRAAGASPNVAHAWTLASGTSNWASVGTDILADGGGGGCTVSPTLTLLGVGNCGG